MTPPHGMMALMTKRFAALLSGLALLGACKDSTGVPDLNNVTTESIAGGLTRVSTQTLITGLLDRERANAGSFSVVFAETMARDIYRLDPAEARFISELLRVPPDPGGFLGGGAFIQYFIGIRTANTILNGIDAAPDLSAAEKSATKGFVNTIKALQYYNALELRDSLGLPTDLNHPATDPPAPFRCKPNVLAFISALLDEAYGQLTATGVSAFPFILPSGFTSVGGDFSSPAQFAKFNRGLAGRTELYRGLDHQKPDPAAFNRAITALNLSFLSTADATPAALAAGVYAQYSLAPGETSNGLADGNIYLNPSVVDPNYGGLQPGDLRVSKIKTIPSKSLNGVKTTYASPLTSSNATNKVRPNPILKNAELILLRAQAYIEKGTAPDLVAAQSDINFVRAVDGGSALSPVPPFLTQDDARTAVLYEKRFSLLLEGAQRIVDLRAYSRNNATYLKQEFPTDAFTSALPIPNDEVKARGGGVITPVCQ
ncbi:MAG: hypothetical protein PVSMB1_08200 [Gemmatimonadaceae bacterium]